jgi:hypothetical protein
VNVLKILRDRLAVLMSMNAPNILEQISDVKMVQLALTRLDLMSNLNNFIKVRGISQIYSQMCMRSELEGQKLQSSQNGLFKCSSL